MQTTENNEIKYTLLVLKKKELLELCDTMGIDSTGTKDQIYGRFFDKGYDCVHYCSLADTNVASRFQPGRLYTLYSSWEPK